MKPFDRIKKWAKTLNNDPAWQLQVEEQCSIQGLEDMVCHLTAETGSLNFAGLFALTDIDPATEKINYILDIVEKLQFDIRDLEPLISPSNKEEIKDAKETIMNLVGTMRNLHCFETN